MTALSATTDPSQWIVLGLLLVLIAAMLWSAHTKQKRLAGRDRTAAVDVRQAADVRQRMEMLMSDLHDLAREMNGRLDTKMRALDQLIVQADERIARLEELQAATESKAKSGASGKRTTRTTKAKPRKRRPTAKAAAPESPAPSAEDDRHSQVYALADQGLGVPEIAEQTGKLTGEVELILSLRERSDASDTATPA